MTGPASAFPYWLKKSLFTHRVRKENGLDTRGFIGWVFCKDMLFQAPGKWWGDRGERDRPHEGVDFLLFTDGQGRIARLEEMTRVPVMYEGLVEAVVDDFLGKSVIVSHRIPECRAPLLSIYGHTRPAGDICPGRMLEEGDVIAALVAPGKSRAAVPPHLHLSLGWLLTPNHPDTFDWGTLNDPATVRMIDPLGALDAPYRVLSDCLSEPAGL